MITRRRTALLLLVFPALPINARALSAQEATLPEKIRKALARNAAQLHPITASWTQQYLTSLRPEEAVAKLKIGRRAEVFFRKRTRRLIWQEAKIYSSRREAVSDGGSETTECCFDGRIFYFGTPDRMTPDGPQPNLSKDLISQLAESTPEGRYLSADYFDAAGVKLPTRNKELHARQSGRSEILALLEAGARLRGVQDVELDGRRATRVELLAENPERRQAERADLSRVEEELRAGISTEERIQEILEAIRRRRQLPETRVYVFYLDPQLGYAVRRREERYEDGTVLLQVNNGEFERMEGRELWLPRKSTVDYYAFVTAPGVHFQRPILSHVMEVSEFSLDRVPDEQFILRYTMPGTFVSDRTAPGGRVGFQIPPELGDLEGALDSAGSVAGLEKVVPASEPAAEPGREGGRTPATLGEGAASGRNWAWLAVILLTVIALAAVAAVAVRRYRRRRAAADG